MDLFVKFGAAESAWIEVGKEGEKTRVNELFFWGVDKLNKQVCLRVRGFPATVRFALDPDQSNADDRSDAFDEYLRSPEFANFALKKLGEKARSWDGEHEIQASQLVLAVDRHRARPADRPVARDWPCWTVSFSIVAAAAAFSYDTGPFSDTPFPRTRVFSASKTGLALLRDFYRRADVAPFCWWRVRGAIPVRSLEQKKAPAGTSEFVLKFEEKLDVIQLKGSERPPRPGTSVLCYDIESIKNYLEPHETGFDRPAEKKREAARRRVDD